ncbi:hypothetical protein N7495_006852 [Penicillium taxi]|uniref:uncharacterized protein n=1 Tax=Penicillium taxi TaxID=168475 RepID=UPI0025455CF7|nr:uncharacterized protein N7495_006852 [Penicillium taxi]KAJ5895161.1 hypothetical protein N7495_006852 [Penicillium taxi]
MASKFMNDDYGSEEEDDDFNPISEEHNTVTDRKDRVDDDDDGGLNDDRAVNEDEDEEDDDEEDEEDDEDEEEEAVKHPRKRRRGGVHALFDEEAGVDEDEDEAEEDEEEIAELGTEMHPDDIDALPVGAETDDRRHRQLDRQRELDATMDAEKQAQLLKERYGRNRAAASDSLVVPKRLLLPGVNDPSIWGGRCKVGKEREVVFSIQKRMEERPPGSRNAIRIYSAFERGAVMQGWFYCEARRFADVAEAIEGINFYYPSQKLILVPVKEMPDLLRVQKSEALVPGGWVRLKRGIYAGDLAQLEEVETNGLTVTVRIVPRLDYGMNEDPFNDPNKKRKRAGQVRPPQRLFSEAEAKKKHGKFLTSNPGLAGKSWNYQNENYFEGFLIKELKIQYLETKDVNPRLEEVTMFARGGEDGTSNLDLASLADTLKQSTADESFLPGDPVEIFRGEQSGLIGRTVSTRNNIVTLKVSEGDLVGQTIDATVETVRKSFREGDHVKVIGNSRFTNTVGMVVQIKDDTVTLLSDINMAEVTVFSKDLRLSSETSKVNKKQHEFDVQDLVQLDHATVGVVVRIDHNSIRVLDQHESIRDMLPTQINLIDRRPPTAIDRNGAEIRTKDIVREVTGEQRMGQIIHVWRSFLFLHSKTQAANLGLLVVRCNNVTAVSARGTRSAGPDLTKMNPALAAMQNRNSAMPPPQRGGPDRLINKTVTIRTGRYKGLIGFVKSADDKFAQVELYTTNKHVFIPRELCIPKDPVTNKTLDMGRGRGGGGRGGVSRVPYGHGPNGGSQGGNSWAGGRTPIAASGRTPAWDGGSSRTPAWGGASGNRTPAWGITGGSRTPARVMDGGRTPYDGGRTPAWGGLSNSREQREQHYEDAPTPGGYSAPTPGAYGAPTPGVSASTPGAWADSAPTPGVYNAPTPGARRGYEAPTPGAYDAPTPAMGGVAATPGAFDDGPHYEDATPSP